MPEKETFSVRLSPDMADAVREYTDEHDVSHADALRRAVRDQYLRPTPDGGELMNRLDSLEDRQDRAARADTLQNVANAVSLVFIAAWFAGFVAGIAALGLAVVVLVFEVAALAYSVGAGGWSA